jgi:hypothetical protein
MKIEFSQALFKDLGVTERHADITSHLICVREVKLYK